MNKDQFCTWLLGRADFMPDTPPTQAEWLLIQERLREAVNKDVLGELKKFAVNPPVLVNPLMPADWHRVTCAAVPDARGYQTGVRA